MKNGRATIARLPTGITGLDDILGGGFPELSFNLLAGAPGCGKTTLAHQIMFGIATPERPALYFTALGEPPLKMLRYLQQFDFFESEQIGRSIHFIDSADEVSSGDLDKVIARIATEVESHTPALVFVDSFRSVLLARRAQDDYLGVHRFIHQLGLLMTSWQATTFLIGEYVSENESSPISTIADGVIWLRQSAERNSVVRKMEVVKMRGQATVSGLHTFRLNSQGITVFSPTRLVELLDNTPVEADAPRMSMGIPELDRMMGGGLPPAFSLLVAGPSGSGKSLMSSAFLVEGARNGETGVIAAFEQRANRSRGPAFASLIANGRIGVIDTRTPGLSVDELATVLLAEIHRLGAKRVVIDSLSGFELGLSPHFRADFRESMSRMVAGLVGSGATVLMTSELEDRFTELSFSPYGTAFLTDAIIVHRYIEIHGRLERMMAVVKVRASAHSNEFHRFHIDDDGIQIDQALAGYEGLLGGSPIHRTGPAVPPSIGEDAP